MVEEVPGDGIRCRFRVAPACALFLIAATMARAAAADEDRPSRAHQQQFKMLIGLGMGASGPSNGSLEVQINRSWFGVTPLLGIRDDVLFNTPLPMQTWPPGTDDQRWVWPDGNGLMGEIGVQYRPFHIFGSDLYRRVDPYAEAAVLFGTMKDRSQFLTAGSLCYGGGVDIQLMNLDTSSRESAGMVLAAEYREYPLASDFTAPEVGAPVRALAHHEALLGIGFRQAF
jgi:hypothetical protein